MHLFLSFVAGALVGLALLDPDRPWLSMFRAFALDAGIMLMIAVTA